ncbi:polysaccharide pyruvyl transferase family protein [Pontibacter sp. BT731]|uniref:polysaccharide pyruvyl transferase family protein n=1 Tax=Pontibacter coccineus TaxID=3063328 RepID=UPI0026E2B434|nr:polysaccharide pyruvyl transferase family protein [Pontibacter sp. BT731]MDO6390228.1 polysaccharide pyruvyl transferase family protein [Pontibacter sp. BT731]
MKILLIGQCTLHWGRMEYGNIGNFYIIEPFIRELHKTFVGAEISTTFQMSDDFCEREGLKCLPMNWYYAWDESDLNTALLEYGAALTYNKTGYLPKSTPFIEEVLNSDLVIDFSGDIWGDNANFLGKDRFLVGLYKDRVAQLLGKPVAMIAGSPGPFKNQETLAFAKEVFENFDLVTNREAVSIDLLTEEGFNVSKVKSLACPAFLFEPNSGEEITNLLKEEGLSGREKPIVGFVLCGWNFLTGPFDKWPRENEEYILFAEVVEYLTEKLNVSVCLMSHSNGFDVPPAPFKLTHGRDYPVAKQLEEVLIKRGISQDFFVLNNIYDTWTTKAIIGNFDMLVSGRVHAAVAGLSQCVPTVVIDYGHEPKAHKLLGFAKVAQAEKYVADPAQVGDMIAKVIMCWKNRETYKQHLEHVMPKVKSTAVKNFLALKEIVDNTKD